MADKISSIALDDVVASAATGVLRALDARRTGGANANVSLDLERNGFYIDFHIIAGMFPPFERLGGARIPQLPNVGRGVESPGQ